MREFMAYSVHQLEWLDTHAASGKAEPLNGIGEGLLVDLGILGADTVADGAVSGGGEFEIHGKLP